MFFPPFWPFRVLDQEFQPLWRFREGGPFIVFNHLDRFRRALDLVDSAILPFFWRTVDLLCFAMLAFFGAPHIYYHWPF